MQLRNNAHCNLTPNLLPPMPYPDPVQLRENTGNPVTPTQQLNAPQIPQPGSPEMHQVIINLLHHLVLPSLGLEATIAPTEVDNNYLVEFPNVKYFPESFSQLVKPLIEHRYREVTSGLTASRNFKGLPQAIVVDVITHCETPASRKASEVVKLLSSHAIVGDFMITLRPNWVNLIVNPDTSDSARDNLRLDLVRLLPRDLARPIWESSKEAEKPRDNLEYGSILHEFYHSKLGADVWRTLLSLPTPTPAPGPAPEIIIGGTGLITSTDLQELGAIAPGRLTLSLSVDLEIDVEHFISREDLEDLIKAEVTKAVRQQGIVQLEVSKASWDDRRGDEDNLEGLDIRVA